MGSAANTPRAGKASAAMRRVLAGATGRSPSGSAKGSAQRRDDVVGGSCRGIPGGQAVPAATKGTGDRGQVVALRPHRHRPVRRLDLLEHRGDLGLLRGAHDVDDALDLLRTGYGPFLVSDNGIHQTTTTGGVGNKLCRRKDAR